MSTNAYQLARLGRLGVLAPAAVAPTSLAVPAAASAPLIGPTGRPTTTYTFPTAPSGAPSVPYSGRRPLVLDLTGTKVKVTTGNYTYDLRRAHGGFWGSGSCSADDQTCAACFAMAGKVGGYDIVIGLDYDGVTPLGLCCVGNAVANSSFATQSIDFVASGSRASNPGDPLAWVAVPGWEMKLALYMLLDALNSAATILGIATVPRVSGDPDNIYLRPAYATQALAVLPQITLARGLSPDTEAFLAAPSLATLAQAAPAINYDIAEWTAVQAAAGTGGTVPSPTPTDTTSAPAPSSSAVPVAIGIGAALLLLARLA